MRSDARVYACMRMCESKIFFLFIGFLFPFGDTERAVLYIRGSSPFFQYFSLKLPTAHAERTSRDNPSTC